MDALPALETAIRQRLCAEGEADFAVVDFDNTCIVNDIGEATLAFMCANSLLRYGGLLSGQVEPCSADYHARVFRHYHRILAQGDIRGASLLCARIFAGFRRDEAAAVVAATLDAEGTLALPDRGLERGQGVHGRQICPERRCGPSGESTVKARGKHSESTTEGSRVEYDSPRGGFSASAAETQPSM